MAQVQSPDDIQMSFGDHLEELRRRLINALIGVAVVCCGTLYYGAEIVLWLQRPLHHIQREVGLPAMTVGLGVSTGFSIYLKVSVIAAIIIASPWVIYQIWKFISAGLYESERRVVMLLAPFSAIMTTLGVLFAYYIMLPLCLAFLISFSTSYPPAADAGPSFMDRLTSMSMSAPPPGVGGSSAMQPPQPGAHESTLIPLVAEDPVNAAEGQIWINTTTSEMKVKFRGLVRSVTLATGSAMSPLIEIGDYTDFVLLMMLGVVVAFQLPLLMLIVGWSGAVNPDWIVPYRKHCVFACFFLGAALTPADPVSMLVLAIPLWILFEFGLWMMKAVYRRIGEDSAAE